MAVDSGERLPGHGVRPIGQGRQVDDESTRLTGNALEGPGCDALTAGLVDDDLAELRLGLLAEKDLNLAWRGRKGGVGGWRRHLEVGVGPDRAHTKRPQHQPDRHADNKRRARLNALTHILSKVPYEELKRPKI